MDSDKSRQKIIQFFFILCSLVILIKAAQIQLFDASYKQQAEKTTLQKKWKYPSRGLIYDRNGKLLVINNPIYDLEVVYNNIDPEMDTLKFCELLNIDRETFEKNLDKNWRSSQVII